MENMHLCTEYSCRISGNIEFITVMGEKICLDEKNVHSYEKMITNTITDAVGRGKEALYRIC